MKLQKNTLSRALQRARIRRASGSASCRPAEIARKYGVSPHHLAKVLRTLGRAGLVESVRGVGGGYRFAGNAKRLTLMDVIELFEDISAPHGESGARGARERASSARSARCSPRSTKSPGPPSARSRSPPCSS